MKVPLTPAAFGVLAGVGLLTGADVDGVVVVPVVPLFVAFFVALGVALGVAAGVFVVEGVVAAGVLVVPPDVVVVVPPPKAVPPSESPLVEPNCGGVMERTAPSPVTVPPAIKKKRLVFILISLIQPSEIQILHCENDRVGSPHRAPLCALFLLNQLARRYKHQSR